MHAGSGSTHGKWFVPRNSSAIGKRKFLFHPFVYWVFLSVLVIALLLMTIAALIDFNNLDSALATTESWLAGS